MESAAFSPNGRCVLTVSLDNTARVWDTAAGQPVAPPMRHEGTVRHAEFSPDGRRVLTASLDETARVWDAATGQPLIPPMRHEFKVNHAAFGPDGCRVVTASGYPDKRGEARVWDADTGRPASPPMRHNNAVWHAAFSPDGCRVLTVSGSFRKEGEAQVWDAATGRPVALLVRHERQVNHAAFSPDGRRVVTACGVYEEAGEARVWDAATGQPASPPLRHERGVSWAVFGPDGRRVLTASCDGTARVWDAATGQPVAPPMRHEGTVQQAAFSADGRRIVTASTDRTARVWDADTGRPLSPPMRHVDAVEHASFSPDGRRVVTAIGTFLDAGEARVWDADTGQLVAPPMRHGCGVWHAAFSPDGRRVLTAGDDGEARVWDVDTGQPLAARQYQARDRIALAHLLSRKRVNSGGELVPLRPEEFRAAWEDLRPRYPEVFECSPQEVLAWRWREATACAAAGAWPGAVMHLDALIKAEPNSQDPLWKRQRLWRLRGDAQAELGRWQQGAPDFAKAIEQDAGDPNPQIGLALVHLAGGDIDDYRRACTRLLRDFGQANNPNRADAVAWTCILAPEAVADREAVVRCAQAAVKATSEDPDKHRYLQTLGAATYRAGRFEEAIGHLNDALKALPEPAIKPAAGASGGVSPSAAPGGNALDWLFLAMAHHRLGHAEEARKWLDKAIARIDQATQDQPEDASSGSRINWRTRLAYRVLRREAEGLIGGTGSGRPKAAGGEKSGQ